MDSVSIYRNSTDKPLDQFVVDLTAEIEKRGFIFAHMDKSNLAEFYTSFGVPWPDNHRHVVLQMCKPENSGKAMQINPERSLLIPKYFFIYSRGGKTEIRFLRFSEQLIADLLGHNEYDRGISDDVFAERMAGNFSVMQACVEAAV